MFDIGWTEIVVILLVSSLMLDIQDIPKIIKGLKKISRYFKELIEEIKVIFNDIEKETNTIIDLDGNEQITYDLNDILPDIKTSKNKEVAEKDERQES